MWPADIDRGVVVRDHERGSAVFSADLQYRYRLTRRLEGGLAGFGAKVAFVMLNPSTADESVDDPTIRRCVGFANRWGAGTLLVVNLFALRATDPDVLLEHPDPVGEFNDEVIARTLDEADVTVAAWGAHRAAGARARELERQLTIAGVVALGTTADGWPRHPLYLRGDAEARRWSVPS